MSKNTKKIIVNTLTASRILGAISIPIIFVTLSVPALISLLALLFITDFLDGKLARKWKVETIGGGLLDPLGDKVLAISCMISLISTETVIIAPLILECAITALNLYRITHNEKVRVSYVGKFKTWLLSITIIIGAINLFNPDLLNEAVGLFGINTEILSITDEIVIISIVITCIVQALTLGVYIKDAIHNKNMRKKKMDKLKDFNEMVARLFDETKFKTDKERPIMEIIRK